MARSSAFGVRLWNVTSSMPHFALKSVKSPMSGSPIVPVPTTCTTVLFAITGADCSAAGMCGAGFSPPKAGAPHVESPPHGHQGKRWREADRLEQEGLSRLLRPAEARGRPRADRHRGQV